jgi:retron-type reverse transcriptase
MKRFGGLYADLVNFENIYLAFHKALRGKKNNPKVAAFSRRQEEGLLSLQEELIEKSYRPGPYRTFIIYDKKPRMISAASFRDRIVHHALCNIIEPLFESGFIFDSYANRKGKGTHHAVSRCNDFARKNPFVLKCDIKKYFPSIDHEILKRKIRHKIKDPNILWLCDVIIDNSNPQEEICDYFAGDDLFTPINRRKGLPIGNQTSQFFANAYLDTFDHFVKERLRCKYYIRYVDDFLIFGKNKEELWDILHKVISFLEKLRLRLHPNKANVFPVKCGIPFLGYTIFPTYRRLASYNVRRFRKRLKRLQVLYAHGELDLYRLRSSIHGWLGHTSHANTYNLRKAIFQALRFV